MPQTRLWIKEETRMLGAIQIMTGILLDCLGLLWMYLLFTQIVAFGATYTPIALLTAYPFWSSWLFIFSGAFTVLLEKRRSPFLVSYALVVNIISACISVIGLLLLSIEFIKYSKSLKNPLWPHKTGKLLLEYLFILTILELFVTSIVIHWAFQAKHTGR
ncbi:membrane-spanning 4-domains subfamily A member 8-like [Trachypithecus francoisi]|uniref:membrane-spanning 4-domains subfamily A member 8-like n=1 Tax=Trachypithecus francoisi TaxID=54180 RepID=UPI00141B8CA0|nr:membrane-spanning 4-domains subfamily A member 8-like [Trachypithecus francoisi]XP_033062415.1 membrane-spanning 4-domains subfamily A member 8-like [Trachypithecus francoisi]XP_033062416.1 membrane-spanning 4-domains subfamily A member 8-like [Trachypithecus francoisi]XP_033062417.1 membrane-spanning 4-domains subfamily A member 8-like [Trachypithecus francoisi]